MYYCLSFEVVEYKVSNKINIAYMLNTKVLIDLWTYGSKLPGSSFFC